MDSKSILHVIRKLSPGGASRALLVLLKSLLPQSIWRHEIYSLLPPHHGLVEQALSMGVAVREGRPDDQQLEAADLVQVHYWNSPEINEWLYSIEIPLRIILSFQVGGALPPQLLTRELLNHSSLWVAGSPFTQDLPVAKSAANHGMEGRLIWICSGAESLVRCRTSPHQGVRIGYLGTVDYTKMHPDFLRLCLAVPIPDALFVVAGTGNALDALKAQVAKENVEHRFEFPGYLHDTYSFWESIDLFGYPLSVDNYSSVELVLQEAMFAGVPAVVLPYGGAARTLQQGETGLIAKTEAEYPSLLGQLWQDTALRHKISSQARQFALTHFNMTRFADAYHELYQEAMCKPKRAHKRVYRNEGVDAFLLSLGHEAGCFERSLTSEANGDHEADFQIARSSVLMLDGHCGGLGHYRHYYSKDPWLSFWHGLALRHQGRRALALMEFHHSIRHGFPGWRAAKYASELAATLGSHEASRRYLQQAVSSGAPEIAA